MAPADVQLLPKQISLQLLRERVQYFSERLPSQSRRQPVPHCRTVEAEAPLAG